MELWCGSSGASSSSCACSEDEKRGGRSETDVEEAEEGGCSLLEAFESFEIRAEKRTSELLENTERELFKPSESVAELFDEDLPAHVYYSDHYRQVKPPDFERWRAQFPYLQVVGATPGSISSGELVRWVPAPVADLVLDPTAPYQNGNVDKGLVIVGTSCVLPLPADTSLLDEEIIACDGVMEELIEKDGSASTEYESERELHTSQSLLRGCLSPRSSRMEESIDALTTTVYASTVASLLTPMFRALLEHQQHRLRVAREDREAKILQEIARQQALEEETRSRERFAMAAEEELQFQLEVMKIEMMQREKERLAKLEEEEQAENDEEEIKIRTLAYTHTREWYQPNKKCYSHRGHQFTYLKPVLKTKGEQTRRDESERKFSPPGEIKGSMWIGNRLQIPQPRMEQSPSLPSQTIEPPLFSTISKEDQCSQHPSHSEEISESLGTEGVRLPLITTPSCAKRTSDDAFGRARSKQDVREAVRAPSRVYVTAPYRIPPPLVADIRQVSRPRSQLEASNQTHDFRGEK